MVPPARQRGFTLIELLVVIAIIAVLASLLMTAINLARATSRKLTCQHNMQQVFLGLQVYCGDFEGRTMPVSDWNGTDFGSDSWGQTWGEVVAVAADMRLAVEPATASGQLGAFHCPENGRQKYQMQWNPGGPVPTAGSYGGNGWYQIANPGTDGQYFNSYVSQFHHPTELLAIIECSRFRTYPAIENGNASVPYIPVGTEFARYAHNGAANVVYADGHQDSMRVINGRGAPTGIPSASPPAPWRCISYVNGRAWYGAD